MFFHVCVCEKVGILKINPYIWNVTVRFLSVLDTELEGIQRQVRSSCSAGEPLAPGGGTAGAALLAASAACWERKAGS